jgi:hypothetical protein
MIATRFFGCAWHKSEKPTNGWSANDWPEFLQKFQGSTPSRQHAVLDMLHPPLSSEAMIPVCAQAMVDTRVARDCTHKSPSFLLC